MCVSMLYIYGVRGLIPTFVDYFLISLQITLKYLYMGSALLIHAGGLFQVVEKNNNKC